MNRNRYIGKPYQPKLEEEVPDIPKTIIVAALMFVLILTLMVVL